MVVRRKKRSSSQQEMPAFTMTTTLVDEEGNEIRTLADAGRVKRETSEKETADVSTTEKVIQVIANWTNGKLRNCSSQFANSIQRKQASRTG